MRLLFYLDILHSVFFTLTRGIGLFDSQNVVTLVFGHLTFTYFCTFTEGVSDHLAYRRGCIRERRRECIRERRRECFRERRRECFRECRRQFFGECRRECFREWRYECFREHTYCVSKRGPGTLSLFWYLNNQRK